MKHLGKVTRGGKSEGDEEQHLLSIPYGQSFKFMGVAVVEQFGEVS